MLTCEHQECNGTIEDVLDTHSLWAVLQKAAPDSYSFFQCEDGQEHNFVNYQHFHCSHAHMQQSMVYCLNNHYTEEKLHSIAAGEGRTILHKIVLGSNLLCKACNTPLTSQAYRFCLTQGLPFHRVPDESLDHLGEWCCTLDHAREQALLNIATLEEMQ